MVALALYQYLALLTGLPMFLTVLRALLVLGLATTMCIVSGLLSLRKVQQADPAEVF